MDKPFIERSCFPLCQRQCLKCLFCVPADCSTCRGQKKKALSALSAVLRFYLRAWPARGTDRTDGRTDGHDLRQAVDGASQRADADARSLARSTHRERERSPPASIEKWGEGILQYTKLHSWPWLKRQWQNFFPRPGRYFAANCPIMYWRFSGGRI